MKTYINNSNTNNSNSSTNNTNKENVKPNSSLTDSLITTKFVKATKIES